MRRSVYSLIIGVVCAIAAIWAVYSLRGQDQSAANASPAIPTTQILIAKADIAYGDKIIPDLVEVTQWPTKYLPKGAITTTAELLEGPESPRIAMRALVAGEPFLKAKVSGFGERPILSRKVAEGMRAITVRINDVSGVAGFILPGDRVDILLTRQIGDGSTRDNYGTDIILQNISVLGIDQLSSEDQDKPVLGKSATFEVTPAQAQALALASRIAEGGGSLSLSLRNYETVSTEKTTRISSNDLGERRAAPAPAPAKPRAAPAPRDTSVYVQVRKGTEVSSEKVVR
jgi:pilus assembly protein CpaB